MATIEDIVKRAGVSRSTVCRFLNGSNVRGDAKKSILEAMEELNYKKQEIHKYQKIEIEISISTNYESFQGFSQIVESITHEADEKEVKVNIAKRTKEQMKSVYENWDNTNSKGVIVVGKNKEDAIYEANMLSKYNIPHIFVNRIFEEPNLNYVSVDLGKGAYDIVNYLIKKGHKDIAVIGCPDKSQVDFEKLKGYKKAHEFNNIKWNDKFYFELNDMKHWEDTVKEILTKEERPTAYFSLCDSYAIKFIKIAKTMGVKIPKDIALVGMDNIDMSEYTSPAITTVATPFDKMGRLAVENLVKLILDEEISSIKTILKHKIIERESC